MDIKNLTTFIYVAELNSFTKAAEKLGFSQSTVSFQIRQLERELNSQLFERVNHTIALTEKGREGDTRRRLQSVRLLVLLLRSHILYCRYGCPG